MNREDVMVRKLLATAFLGALLSAPAVRAQESTAAPTEREQSQTQLFRRIQREVLQYPHYSVFDSVSVRIDEGVVTLVGRVTMPFKSEDLQKRIAKVNGVTKVENRLETLPASKSDDELRVRIADAIYGHPTFQPYAAQPNPPIHIIVERGRVTLEGVVQDDAERLLAMSLAGSRGSLQLKNELRTTKEVNARQR
jgi:hyperosmotically inducible protein